MKKVILGCAYILCGLVLTIFALFGLKMSSIDALPPICLIIGISLFLIGSVLGIAGLLDDK